MYRNVRLPDMKKTQNVRWGMLMGEIRDKITGREEE